MAYEKVKHERLFGYTGQGTLDAIQPVGDSSGGTFTQRANPMSGTDFWDSCMYVVHGVSVAGGATAGSFAITVVGTVDGVTGLPIAEVSGLGTNSSTSLTVVNLHNSPSSILPAGVIVQDRAAAAAGTVSFQLWCLAKQYRGSGRKWTKDRTVSGTLFRSNTHLTTPIVNGDDTIDLSVTGASGNFQGLDAIRLWDNALYWFTHTGIYGVTGSSSIYRGDIVGAIGNTTGGNTITIATATGLGQLSDAPGVIGEKLAMAQEHFGISPRPDSIILTETTAGTGLSGVRVLVAAKTGRGTLAG
jgi:hypothetical protein